MLTRPESTVSANRCWCAIGLPFGGSAATRTSTAPVDALIPTRVCCPPVFWASANTRDRPPAGAGGAPSWANSALDVHVDGPKKLMFSEYAGEIWAGASSPTRRPERRIESTARPLYSGVSRLSSFRAWVR